MSSYAYHRGGLRQKLYDVNWFLPALIMIIGGIGVAAIYAATDGVWQHGAYQHFMRLIFAGLMMLIVAMIDIRFWYHFAYPAYFACLVLLLGVDIFGVTVNGSQRWLDLYVTRVQPSEFMKIAIVLAMARYYHDLPQWRVSHISGIMGAILIIFLPMQFILRQPDLGTTLLLVVTGVTIVYLAGINWRVIISSIVATALLIPLFVKYWLKPYQWERLKTFLDPSRDPTGAGYHITQSKIALGSGGVSGKGYMKGTQRQLEYVPENRTDFIFTIIGEEFGLIGGLVTMSLYMTLIGLCIWLALECRNMFSKLMVLGLTTTFSLYIIINLAMVMGLAPVVGVPLALISYGGTVILAVMFGFGLILSAHLHKQVDLPRSSNW